MMRKIGYAIAIPLAAAFILARCGSYKSDIAKDLYRDGIVISHEARKLMDKTTVLVVNSGGVMAAGDAHEAAEALDSVINYCDKAHECMKEATRIDPSLHQRYSGDSWSDSLYLEAVKEQTCLLRPAVGSTQRENNPLRSEEENGHKLYKF